MSLVERLVLIYLLLSSRAVPGYIKRFRLILCAHMAANIQLISRMTARCSSTYAGAWRCCPALPKMAIFFPAPRALFYLYNTFKLTNKGILSHSQHRCMSATALRSARPRPHRTQQQPSLGVERESVTARIAHDRASRIQEEDVANQASIHRR
jgi:hypothetical protein